MNDSIVELTPLQFSACKPRYESTARYTNGKNQSFLIRVSSDDRQLVEEYTKNLQVNLELISSELAPDSTYSPSGNIHQPEISNNFEEREIIEPEAKDKFLRIYIEGDREIGINLEQDINFSFRRKSYTEVIPIEEGVEHWAEADDFHGNEFKVTVYATRDGLEVDLLRRKSLTEKWKIIKPEKITRKGNNIDIEHSQREKAYFALRIKAAKQNEYYTAGSIRVIEPDEVIVG